MEFFRDVSTNDLASFSISQIHIYKTGNAQIVNLFLINKFLKNKKRKEN